MHACLSVLCFMSNDDKLLVVSVMLPSLVKPSGGASAWSIINAADALGFTGGHSHLLSLSHIILISPHSIKTGRTDAERQTRSDSSRYMEIQDAASKNKGKY